MNISFFLAKTYLLSIKNKTFISFINVLAFLGLVIGIASLICVTSIFNGFRLLVRDMLLTIDPHIRITLTNQHDANSIKKLVYTHANNASIDESIIAKIIVSHKTTTQAGIIFGTTNSRNNLDNHVAIGIGLADKLGVVKGDTISLSTPEMIDIAISGMAIPSGIPVIIDSIFQISSGVQYDNAFIIANASLLRKNAIYQQTYADIRLNDPDEAFTLKQRILTHPKYKNLHVETWEELHEDLYATMKFERNMSFIILGIISFVSAFNILIGMWMMVKAKSKDIAILRSMGMKQQNLKKVFLFQGLIIGLTGTLIGAILGILLCKGQEMFGWITLPNSIVQSMPVALSMHIVCISIVLGIAVSVLASLYPASIASSSHITEQLRHE